MTFPYQQLERRLTEAKKRLLAEGRRVVQSRNSTSSDGITVELLGVGGEVLYKDAHVVTDEERYIKMLEARIDTLERRFERMLQAGFKR